MSMLPLEEAIIAYPNVIETSVVMRPGVMRPGSATEPSKRVLVVLDDGSDHTVRSFCEWCQRNLRDVLKGVEVHVLSALAKAGMGSVPRRKLVAVFDSKEAWISTGGDDVAAKQQTEPWVKLSSAMNG